jgi:hypothetical protein
MEYLKPKIEFYRQRTFSEKMNVIFAFIRENWRPLLKYSFYLVMPICLIQTLIMNSLILSSFQAGLESATSNNPFANSMISLFSNFGLLIFCTMIGSTIMMGLIYAMMQTYNTRENRLQDVTLNDFKNLLLQNAWKYLRLVIALILAFLLLGMILGSMAAVALQSLVITIPILLFCLVCLIPLSMAIPAYIFERDLTFMQAIRKGWKLGYATFGGILGLMIVLYFLSYAIQTITLLPWYAVLMVGTIMSVTTESVMNQSVAYKFILYILGLIQSYGSYVASMIGIIGLAFQYFHAREKVEGVTIESNIANFSKL